MLCTYTATWDLLLKSLFSWGADIKLKAETAQGKMCSKHVPVEATTPLLSSEQIPMEENLLAERAPPSSLLSSVLEVFDLDLSPAILLHC